MEEVKDLTVAAIDWLIEGIGKEDGLIRGFYDLGRRHCALGAIGFEEATTSPRCRVRSRARHLGLIDYHGFSLTHAAQCVTNCNDHYVGSPEERKTHVLAWLREQRALKCSDWTAPIKEVVPDRKAVLA